MIQKISLNPTENIIKGKLALGTTIAMLLCDVSEAFSVDLPDAQDPNIVMIRVKKTDDSSNAVTFNAINQQTIDGAASVALSTQYDTFTLVRDGSNWHRVDIIDESLIDHTAISNIGTNTHAEIDTHIASDGSDHTFINQDVTITGTPTFKGTTISRTDANPVLVINYGATANTYDPQIALQENSITIWSIGIDTNNGNRLIITPNTSVRGKSDFVFDPTFGAFGVNMPTPAGDSTIHVSNAAKDTIHYVDNFSTDLDHHSRLTFRKSNNNTTGVRGETLNNHILGSFQFYGVNTSSAWALGGSIYVQQTTAAGTYIPTTFKFHTYSATAFNPNQLSLYHDNNVGMNGVFPPTDALHIGGNFRHSADNQFNYFGAANDSGITDDGSKMIFDCDIQSAGSRYFDFVSGDIYIAGTQILTTQQAHIADADGTLASATTAINAILSMLETHGLVASS